MSKAQSESVWHVELDDERPELVKAEEVSAIKAEEVSAVEASQVSAVDSE